MGINNAQKSLCRQGWMAFSSQSYQGNTPQRRVALSSGPDCRAVWSRCPRRMKNPYGEKGLGSIIDLPNFLSCNVMLLCQLILFVCHFTLNVRSYDFTLIYREIFYFPSYTSLKTIVSYLKPNLTLQLSFGVWYGTNLISLNFFCNVIFLLMRIIQCIQCIYTYLKIK
jgi:hypothetical protein